MKNTIWLGIIGLTMGCQTDTINPDLLLDYQEKIVVNGIFEVGKPLAIQVSKSLAVVDSTFPKLIKDADVSLTTLATSPPITYSMTYSPLSDNYESNVTMVADESVSILIKHPSYPRVTSVIRIPKSINATAILTPDGGLDTAGLPGDLLEISFNDAPGINNYYRLSVEYWNPRNPQLTRWVPLNFTMTDPSLAEYNSYRLQDASVLFADELFKGSAKTIQTVAPAGLVSSNTGNKYRMRLSSISQDYFNYHRSLQRARDSKEISFDGGYNNAVVIHSNINNGLGIIGTQNTNEIILK